MAADLSELVDVSQHGESNVLAALLAPDWPEYLVDVGAHDGRSLSNSYPFVELGWNGVLLEPLPQAFGRLEQLHRGRPGVICVQAACGTSDGELPLFLGDDGPWTMTSTLRHGGGSSVIVRVRTLTSVLEECDAPADFSVLLVDAEGMDHEVLAGLDFARFRPRIVVTEDGVANDLKYQLLEARGYALYTVVAGINSIWISADLAPAAMSLPLSPEEALETVGRDAMERRCAELQRSRDEIWQRLVAVETSKSWQLTRPLRDLVRRLRSLRARDS